MAKTLLERADRFRIDKLESATSVEVAYIVHPHALERVPAIPGNADVATIDLESAVASAKRFDWIIDADKLVVNSVKVEPAKGHEIWRTLRDGRRAIYEVLPLANERCYSPSGQMEMAYRIHTKLKEIEAAP